MNLPWYFILNWKLQSCDIFLIAYFIPLAITKKFLDSNNSGTWIVSILLLYIYNIFKLM